MKKLTLAQVKAKIKKEGDWKGWLCPSKCYPNPGHPFNLAIKFDTKEFIALRGIQDKLTKLDKTVNEFSYYNCNKEVGTTVHYYEEEK